MKKILSMAAIGTVAALALAACGSAPTTTPSAGASSGGTETTAAATPSATPINFKACIVSDAGGFDDKSFNQLSFEGVQKATKDLGAQFASAQSNAATDYAPNLQAMATENCNLIFAVGFNLSADTVTAAQANPTLKYALIDDAADNNQDGKTDAPNIKPILYDTAQAAFLAGYLAAGYSKVGKVGTFGGQPYPTVTIFMDGFLQGVKYYNQQKGKSVQVVGWDGTNGLFTGGFDANDTAKGVAQQVIDQGVDVILPVGGPIYQSALAAIQDSGKDIAMIGVDADQYVTDPNVDKYILTSIEKKMDTSSYDTVTAAAKGDFDPTAYIGTLANSGVDIAPLHDYESKVDPALVTEVTQLKQDIIDGKVKVTSYLDK
ncbi:MAG TPA: BMP family ABC transporter substrate-binding protein [Cellulomonas sp.]